MKKLLLLLLPFFAMAQSPDATQIENILLLNNTEQTSATRVIVQDAITKELKFVLKANVVPQANATTSGTVRITTAENNPQVYTVSIADNLLNAKVNSSEKGAANGVASLDGSGKVPLAQINDALLGSVNYKGTYNATTNVPALPAAGASNKGFYYIVSTAGTQFSLVLNVGDWIISNGTEYGKVDNNNAVTSVAGKVGAVILNSGDVNLGNVNNTTDLNKPISTANQTALNAKISGTGTTNQLAKFTASGEVGSSSIFDNGNVGIGTTTPTERLDVVGNGKFSGNLTTSQDNTMIRVGNNGDIALIKKGGFVGKLAVALGTPFVLTRSNNATINPSDTFSDIFTIDTNNNGLFTGTVTAAPATASNHLVTLGQVRPYKVYVALLTQSGTSAPVATVLENTLGGTVVWSRSSVGIYLGTLTGAFTLNKTVSFISGDQSADKGYGIDNLSSVDDVRISTRLAGSLNDNQLNKASIEIRVYN